MTFKKNLTVTCVVLTAMFSLFLTGCASDPTATTPEKLGTCGAPGYSWWSPSGSCTIYLTWECASPCTPTVTSQTLVGTATDQYTETVYCEHPDYYTSEGMRFTYWCR